MIAVHIKDGLGNQLFQYAIGRCLAYKNNTELKLEIFEYESLKTSHHNHYLLGNFNIQENFATPEDIRSLKRINEKHPEILGIFEPNLMKTPDNSILYGCFQTEKYFEDIEDILRQELTPKNPFGRKSNLWKEKILSAECAVSLHIRHGDYLTPHARANSWGHMVPMDYYTTCINELKKVSNNLTVFIFSDDLKWCKENFKLDVPMEFVEGCESDVDELFLMSCCKHNITVNSTFSWWGGWLNNNPDKKVFSPTDINESSEVAAKRFFISEKFIKVPVNYHKNQHVEFPPFISVILYVKDDINTVEFAMQSILSQNSNDYELIVIDSSNDGSGKICRRFTERENVSVIKQIHSVGKFETWNKGLECACGYYVQFLTCKDFLLYESVKNLVQFSYDYQVHAQVSKSDYLCYENYFFFYPNVICSTKMLEENLSGNLRLNENLNKNFTIKTDLQLQNLRGIGEFKLSVREKIIMLFNQQINSCLGTKLFKRTFLNENNIRFNEKNKFDTQDTELQFLTEVFIKTEEICFIPQLFYGHML